MNLQNLDYDNELNNRLKDRWFPSDNLQPLYDIRPVSTKYTWFQTVEETPNSKVNTLKYLPYTPSKVFNPGSRAPSDFFLSSIDQESRLRNQFMALQKGDQAVYVPCTQSDLYQNPMDYDKSKNIKEVNNIQSREHKVPNINTELFHNPTRTNIRK
jgi:hypothetical protein